VKRSEAKRSEVKRGEAKRGEAKRGEARNTTGAEQNRYAPEVFRRCNARAPTRTHLCPASGLKGRDSEQCPRQSPAQRVAWSLAALHRLLSRMLSVCSGMERIRAEGGKTRTGCSHRTRPRRFATNYTHCGTSTLLSRMQQRLRMHLPSPSLYMHALCSPRISLRPNRSRSV